MAGYGKGLRHQARVSPGGFVSERRKGAADRGGRDARRHYEGNERYERIVIWIPMFQISPDAS